MVLLSTLNVDSENRHLKPVKDRTKVMKVMKDMSKPEKEDDIHGAKRIVQY